LTRAGGIALLVDTCVVIRVMEDIRIDHATEQSMSAAADDGRLFVSPISAWEIALAMTKGRLTSTISAITYFNRFVEASTSALCELSPEILAASCSLPMLPHRDPADCILVATARALNLVLVTSDRKILDYGASGYVKVMPLG
jgi:PIN domain nuclease of toxin-antitoxin system